MMRNGVIGSTADSDSVSRGSSPFSVAGNLPDSNFIGVWLSLVERYVRDVEVAGSNPVTPIFSCKNIGFRAPDSRYLNKCSCYLVLPHGHKYKEEILRVCSCPKISITRYIKKRWYEEKDHCSFKSNDPYFLFFDLPVR